MVTPRAYSHQQHATTIPHTYVRPQPNSATTTGKEVSLFYVRRIFYYLRYLPVLFMLSFFFVRLIDVISIIIYKSGTCTIREKDIYPLPLSYIYVSSFRKPFLFR